MEFTAHFRAARRVSTPLIAIRTFDAASTLKAVRTALETGKTPVQEIPMILWDGIHGMRALTKQGKDDLAEAVSKADSAVAATLDLKETLRIGEFFKTDALLFISNAHLHWKGEPNVIQAIWNLRDTFKGKGNMLILLCNPGAVMPTELTNDILVMDEPLPTVSDLERIVLTTFKDAGLKAPGAEVLGKATDALIGLPAFPSEQATAMCLNHKAETPDVALDVKELWGRKRDIIGQTPGLSVWQGNERLEDIGGIQAAKDFFSRVVTGQDAPKTIIFMDEVEKAFAGTGTDMSGVKTELTGSMLSWMQDTDMDGSILMGIPGVSKSTLAKALGNSYGIPVINFDLAGMQSSLIGSSGANLRQAQKTVDAISGGRVLALATCNSINALPPELRRRFNLGIFFFDEPTAEEREAIWDIYRQKYSIAADDTTPESRGWTGAEIKECCKKAYRLRLKLSEAAKYIVPVTQSAGELIQNLRLQSSGKYLSASKPGIYKHTEAESTDTSVVPSFLADTTSNRRIREMN